MVLALEPVAVAGQCPSLGPTADGPRLPAEHRSVERLRPFDVTGVEPVEDHRPRSLTSRAPLCSLASHRPNAAPSGSLQIAIRQASRRSKGSIRTAPPASRTRDAASSALSTQKYVFHIAIAGPAAGIERTPATSPLSCAPERSKIDELAAWCLATKYFSPEPAGDASPNSQPKSPL